MSSFVCTITATMTAVAALSSTRGAEPVVLKRNAGWCWFQDERAIVAGEELIFASVAGTTRDSADAGDIEVTAYDLRSGKARTFKLHPKFQSDDHDVAALLELPDGRILATWQSHGSGPGIVGTNMMHWRVTLEPRDISRWTEIRSLDTGRGISYSNLHQLTEEGGQIYNFFRGDRNPHYLVSDDSGASFRFGGKLLHWPRPDNDDPKYSGIDGGRPYLRYVSDGRDTIHFTTTEDHPRAYDNSVYHAFIRGGKIHHSDGSIIGELSRGPNTPHRPTDLTRIFEGDADNVAWTSDIALDALGHPIITFSVQKDGAPFKGHDIGGVEGDHRYHYARWDGEQWHVHEIAYAGTRLYPREDDYTGLSAIDPQRPNVVFISTNAHPTSGEPLISASDGRRHWEIFRGETSDLGRTWSWHPITTDSTQDNLRPIIPRTRSGRSILLWLRGTFTTFRNYDQDVVGLLEAP